MKTTKSLCHYALIASLWGLQASGAHAALPDAATPITRQQEKRITGRVVDQTGEPVLGATVVDKQDPNNGTITNVNGHYSIRVQDNSLLVFSYIGYESVTCPADEIDGTPTTRSMAELASMDIESMQILKDAAGNWVLEQVRWKEYLDEAHTMKAADTDWQKEILRTG